MSASAKSGQSPKPPDYDEEFTQAVEKFREQHKLPADDAVLLLVEFEERAARMESDIKDSQKRATELEAKGGSPFEKEERYHKLVTRQSEIEEKLNLTKNQAPSQLDTRPTDEREDNSEKQTDTKSIQQTRRAAVRV